MAVNIYKTRRYIAVVSVYNFNRIVYVNAVGFDNVFYYSVFNINVALIRFSARSVYNYTVSYIKHD
jgi:hypothetical protein